MNLRTPSKNCELCFFMDQESCYLHNKGILTAFEKRNRDTSELKDLHNQCKYFSTKSEFESYFT